MEGQTSFDTTIALSKLGLCLDAEHKYEEAEAVFEQLVKIYREILGPDGPHAHTAALNLGIIYYEDHKFDRAKPLLQNALSFYDQKPGKTPATLRTLINCLAETDLALNEDAEAERMLQRLIQTSSEELGSEDRLEIAALSKLAQMYVRQEEYVEAEPLVEHLIAIASAAPTSDATIAVNGMAVAYYNQGQYKRAKLVEEKELPICNRLHGDGARCRAYALLNLGYAYQRLNDPTHAERFFRDS